MGTIEIEVDGITIRAGRGADANMIAAIVQAQGEQVIGPSGTVRVMVATKPLDFREAPKDWRHWCARP